MRRPDLSTRVSTSPAVAAVTSTCSTEPRTWNPAAGSPAAEPALLTDALAEPGDDASDLPFQPIGAERLLEHATEQSSVAATITTTDLVRVDGIMIPPLLTTRSLSLGAHATCAHM